MRKKIMSEEIWRIIFSKRLKERLAVLDMKQIELAIATNMSESVISRLVNGWKTPSAYDLTVLARALGCSVSDLADM